MSQTPAPAALCSALELSINQYLSLDKQAIKAMLPFSDKVLRVELSDLGWTLHFFATQDGFLVQGNYPGDVDTTIAASSLTLTRLTLASDSQKALRELDVRIDGNAHLAQAFSATLRGVELDWEEGLSRLTGDLLAHRVGSGVRAAVQRKKDDVSNLKDTAVEWLQEEARILPTRLEAEDLMQRVDDFRDRVARLEARIRHLSS